MQRHTLPSIGACGIEDFRVSDFDHKVTDDPLWRPKLGIGECGTRSSKPDPRQARVPLIESHVRIASQQQDKCGLIAPTSTNRGFPSPLDSLKACARQKDLSKGIRIHADILERGLLQEDVYVGTTLLHMYAKCGALAKAQHVFEELPVQNLVSWNALITGYADHGDGHNALACFGRMQEKGFLPNRVTFICVLKACGNIGSAEQAEDVHTEVARQGLLKKDIVLGNALVDMYAKCNELAKARKVFDQLPGQDVVSWSSLIVGYAQHGYGSEAVNLFEQMKEKDISANAVTFIGILKACGSLGAAEKGEEVHALVVRQGLFEKEVVLGNALVDMYAKCGALEKALAVFDELPLRNAVSWNTLITGFAQDGHADEALGFFELMQDKGLSPNVVTFTCALAACGYIGAIEKGEKIHEEIVRQGLVVNNVMLGTTLVDMYVKCDALTKAHSVFDELPVQNVISWNALIAGYVQCGYCCKALNSYKQMIMEGLSPSIVTFVCILSACANAGAINIGEEIHAEIARQSLLEKDAVLCSTLVNMYAQCGMLAKAWDVFNELSFQDVGCWNVLIAGCVQHGLGDKALYCFNRMIASGLLPSMFTYASIMKACGIIGAAGIGEKIHAEVAREGLLSNLLLGTALVDMLAKCGKLQTAQELFDELLVRDVVTWSALMRGYSLLGKVETVFEILKMMIAGHVMLDSVTLSVLLTSCSHVGLVKEGEVCFGILIDYYDIMPTLEHLTCMVDIFSRAGHFNKAVRVIEQVAPCDQLPLWCALLGACQKWVNVELGRWAFEQTIQLNEKCASSYACMINIYAAAGMQEEAVGIEAMQVRKEADTLPGCSWWIDGNMNMCTLWEM